MMPRIIAAIILMFLMSPLASASAPQPPEVPGTRLICVDKTPSPICHIFGDKKGGDFHTKLRQAESRTTRWSYVDGCIIGNDGYGRYRRDNETCLGYWTNKQLPQMTETDRLKARVLELQMALASEMSMAQTQHDIDHCSEVASQARDAEHRDVFFQTCMKVQREARRMRLVKKGILLPEVQ